MSIDTKTTAGGVVLLFLSGSGSYLATSAVSGESNTPTTSLTAESEMSSRTGENLPSPTTSEVQNQDSSATPEVEGSSTVNARTEEETTSVDQEPAKTSDEESASVSLTTVQNQENSHTESTNEKTASESTGATSDTPKSQEEEVTQTIRQEITKAQFENVNEEEVDCKEALDNTYSIENFKSAVKTCFKNKTFRDRANQLNIQLINNSSESQLFTERFNSLNATVVKELADKTVAKNIQTVSGQATSATVPDFCQKVEILTWSSISNTSYPIEEEWKGYLKLCAKDKDENKDFWTGQKTEE